MSAEIPAPRTDGNLLSRWSGSPPIVLAEFAEGLEHEIYHLSKSLDREIAINLERSHELGLMELAAKLAREALSEMVTSTESWNESMREIIGRVPQTQIEIAKAKEAISALDSVLKS